MELIIGKKYRFMGKPEVLIYVGEANDWYEFECNSTPYTVHSAFLYLIKPIEDSVIELHINNHYRFIGCNTEIVFIGKQGNWNQFTHVDNQLLVWCELLDSDLHLIEPIGIKE